jgi:CO/xanthine dehydrogenase Mo-binding subunit/aerobic-type carbon monoxide dehydrogenase small subunit (CoxS/CutS family)
MTTSPHLVRCSFVLNGRDVELEVSADETLLHVLRERLGLHGTRRNCEQGECGACTVLLDDEPVNSCLVLGPTVAGHSVKTIEGLQSGGSLASLQAAFVEAHAAQCGYCTSGMIMASGALLAEQPNPTREQVSSALAGNYCRCTGYRPIVDAVTAASHAPVTVEAEHSTSHVTGRTRYLGDILAPGMLHGAFVRLPVARARIGDIDVSEAVELAGVVRIFTAKDFAETGVPRFGPLVADQPILAAEITHYQGEPVALVVGESEEAARAGARAVQVAYDVLPAILTKEQALSADLIHDPGSRPAVQERWAHSNIMQEWSFSKGDPAEIEKLAQSAALVVENAYSAPFAHHFPLESYAALAIPSDDTMLVLSPIQHPFVMRRVLATMLGMQQDQVRVESVDMGGGFGGKGYPKVEPIAAWCSKLLGRPLRISLTAEESFMAAHREASHIHVRTGFSSEGDILFQDIEADFLVGAYTDISPAVVTKTTFYALGPYRTPCARIRGRGLFTTTTPTTAFRGFGATHMNMALEGQMNAAARRLGIDPVQIRLRNAREHGEEIWPGDTPVDGDWPGLLKKVAAEARWDSLRRSGRGRGIAFGMKVNSAATTSSARVHLDAEGRVTAYVGATEMGQGQRDTVAIIVGEALGVPRTDVSVIMGDTGIVPFDSWTASSRTTVFSGNALRAACQDLRRQLSELAGDRLKVPKGEVSLEEGKVVLDGRAVPLDELLSTYAPGGVTGEGTYSAKVDPNHPMGGPAPFYEVVATAVELHIDIETGQVFLDSVTHGSDAGRVFNPDRARSVDVGGLAMGQSLTLYEHLAFDNSGRLLNGSSLDYRIATVGDMPHDVTVLYQENADGPGPLGAKGLAEGGILAIGPAICGAILDLTGLLPTEIPITPERIWQLLQGSGQRKAGSDKTGGA